MIQLLRLLCPLLIIQRHRLLRLYYDAHHHLDVTIGWIAYCSPKASPILEQLSAIAATARVTFAGIPAHRVTDVTIVPTTRDVPAYGFFVDVPLSSPFFLFSSANSPSLSSSLSFLFSFSLLLSCSLVPRFFYLTYYGFPCWLSLLFLIIPVYWCNYRSLATKFYEPMQNFCEMSLHVC